MPNQDPSEGGPDFSWRALAIFLASFIGFCLSIAGWLWDSSLRDRIVKLESSNGKQWERISENAGMATRLTTHERDIERIQERIRELEIKHTHH